jgi:macrolide-specific efflux system membrane fusion protein
LSPIQAGQAPADRGSLHLNGYSANSRPAQHRPAQQRQEQEPARRHITRPQRVGAALIAGVCVFAAAWYVPKIAAADDSSMSGTVASNGTIYLNFSSSGQLAAITAHVGQQVRKGQLLATEAAPANAAVLAADRAAISADKTELSTALAADGPTATATDAARVQLARDEAQLAVDRADAAGTRIVAPSAGTVVAVNGLPGETTDADGIRDYASQTQSTAVTQRPLFSLFPEGPQSSVAAAGSASLPVIVLRTSNTWQVSVLVPEGSVGSVRPGQTVSIDVPAAGITAVPGRIQEVLNTPVATSQGTGYEAVVTVLDPQQESPPSGMAANVQLGS